MEVRDEILWNGLMEGNRDMFLTIYRKYYHSLLFIGLKEVKDAQLVKDSIQQQFLYLWEKRESIQPAKNVKAYLVASFLRRLTSDWKKSERVSPLHIACNNISIDPPPTPEECLIAKDGQTQLGKLLMCQINTLPARQRELIILRFYEGLPYEEIVQRTGLSPRTVYNKIYEGLKKMKSNLEKEQFSYRAVISGILSVMLGSFQWATLDIPF